MLADLSDEAKAADAAAALTVTNSTTCAATSRCRTPAATEPIAWASDEPATVSATGEVHRPAHRQRRRQGRR